MFLILSLFLTMQWYFKLLINEFTPSQDCFAYNNHYQVISLSLSQPRSFPVAIFPLLSSQGQPPSTALWRQNSTPRTPSPGLALE